MDWSTFGCLPLLCLKDASKPWCNNFLWSGDITKMTNAKVSWEKESEGGLGLRNLLVWNKVLNLKLVWLKEHIFTVERKKYKGP